MHFHKSIINLKKNYIVEGLHGNRDVYFTFFVFTVFFLSPDFTEMDLLGLALLSAL